MYGSYKLLQKYKLIWSQGELVPQTKPNVFNTLSLPADMEEEAEGEQEGALLLAVNEDDEEVANQMTTTDHDAIIEEEQEISCAFEPTTTTTTTTTNAATTKDKSSSPSEKYQIPSSQDFAELHDLSIETTTSSIAKVQLQEDVLTTDDNEVVTDDILNDDDICCHDGNGDILFQCLPAGQLVAEEQAILQLNQLDIRRKGSISSLPVNVGGREVMMSSFRYPVHNIDGQDHKGYVDMHENSSCLYTYDMRSAMAVS